jgi:UDP-N-acetylglucosamine acyltransferase
MVVVYGCPGFSEPARPSHGYLRITIMPQVHSTAIVDPHASLADDVEVGPYCVIERDVTIGPGCRLENHVTIRRHTTIGRDNILDTGCVMGGVPQDLKFDPRRVSFLQIGDGNVFREGVTISRATGEGLSTLVGSHTYWMTGAHAGHNATIEDEAILVNQCAVAGHATVGRRAVLSAHVVMHQFCWLGEMVMSQGNAGTSCHVPPYTLIAGVNAVAGLNAVGLRRAIDITDKDRSEIKEAFCITYRSSLTPAKALDKMDAHTEWGAAAGKFRDFVRRVLQAQPPFKRPLCPLRHLREE